MSMHPHGFPARWLLAIAISGAFAGGELPTATTVAQSGTRFRTVVNYVEIDAVVVDSRGDIVRDLQPADFEVLEDGRPQQVTTFRLVGRPRVGPGIGTGPSNAAALPSPDTVSNDRAGDARLYVLVLDDLHTAPERSARVRELAARVIRADLQPGDVMALVTTGSTPRADHDFTSDPRRLLQAVDAFAGTKPLGWSQTLAEGGCFRL